MGGVMLSSGNPGGPGQAWTSKRYVQHNPKGMKLFQRVNDEGKPTIVSIFIPAKLEDNPGMQDPEKYRRIVWEGVGGDSELFRALMEGDYDAQVQTTMFGKIWRRSVHVVKPFPIPEAWPVWRAYDWGETKPYSIGWYTRVTEGFLMDHVDEEGNAVKVYIPKGSVFKIGEVYG